MDIERRRVDAEAEHQQYAVTRQAAERARATAEESRPTAEHGRRAAAAAVSATIATLTTFVSRREALEALGREARNDTK